MPNTNNITIEQTAANEWYIVSPRGKYVITFTDRGFKGYQIEAQDTTGEKDLTQPVLTAIVNHFKLTPSRKGHNWSNPGCPRNADPRNESCDCERETEG